MTNEQIARETALTVLLQQHEFDHELLDDPNCEWYISEAAEPIYKAIQNAIEQERERCAKK